MWIGEADLRRGAFGQPSVPFLLPVRAHLLTTPKGGGIAYGNRALCEADTASAEASGQCNTSAELLSLSTQSTDGYIRQLPAQTCHRQLCRSYGCVLRRNTPIFLRKRKNNERTVRIDGDLPSGSKGHQPRCRTKRRCCRSLHELLTNPK